MTGIDWTDAFDNSGYVPDAARHRERWPVEAAAFRDRMSGDNRVVIDIPYGSRARNRLDLFHTTETVRGLVVFIHGGYWQMLDKSYWSHLAQGPLAHGWDVAMPSYTLAPEARISDITVEIAEATGKAASMVKGPIRLIGHSAGGHLVSRMVCDNSPLPDTVRPQIEKVVSVSGVHDLRPLLLADMNTVLNLTEEEAVAESPALHAPLANPDVTFWVGANERPEFLRQTRLICEKWEGLRPGITAVYEIGRNHFSVIEGMADPDSPLVRELLG